MLLIMEEVQNLSGLYDRKLRYDFQSELVLVVTASMNQFLIYFQEGHMNSLYPLKRLLTLVPQDWQSELKRLYYSRQIRHGTFFTTEPEYALLDSFISPGNWIIDIGANVGHYTKRFSELTGPSGRVVAFEPVPETFTLLASNLIQAKCSNVTLINAAASDKSESVGMNIPNFKTGLKNFYEAHITANQGTIGLNVLALSIDSLAIPHKVSLVKIDAEGYELSVLTGMAELLLRDHPLLIVETENDEAVGLLSTFGYNGKRLHGSPNMLFRITLQQGDCH